jgi:delta-aminolevulinic acid dehydratase/porphobilinogen synthase
MPRVARPAGIESLLAPSKAMAALVAIIRSALRLAVFDNVGVIKDSKAISNGA